jgi:asparagine synthetase B (glutamine-hydrolysing)
MSAENEAITVTAPVPVVTNAPSVAPLGPDDESLIREGEDAVERFNRSRSVAERAMSELLSLLRGAVERRTDDDTVALLLSGGIDSTSVGIALQECGRTVRAYTYRLRGYPSRDIEKAIKIANHFAWHLTVVEVPIADVANDFVRLAVEHRCRKKTQFEVAFPLLYVLPSITETEVWTGWNADDHYGNTKNYVLHQERMARAGASPTERKAAFDAERNAQFERKVTDPESGTW